MKSSASPTPVLAPISLCSLSMKPAQRVPATGPLVGFIQAIGLCQDDWEPLATDPVAGSLIEPIMLIASTTDTANLDEDERLPDSEMDLLMAEAGPMLSLCASGIRRYFQTCKNSPRRPRKRKEKLR